YADLGVKFNFHVKPILTMSVNATTVQVQQPFIFYGRVFPSDSKMNFSVYNGTTLIDGGSTGASNDSASGPNYEGIYSQLKPGSYTLTVYASGYNLGDAPSVSS